MRSFAIISLIVASTAFTAADDDKLTRNSIIEFAKTGVGSPYKYGGSQWSATKKKWGGVDCSAYTQKSWRAPYAIAPEIKIPWRARRLSQDFYYPKASSDWTVVDNPRYVDAKPGDALATRCNGGHVVIVNDVRRDGIGTYQAKGHKKGVGYFTMTYGYLKKCKFKTLRRKGLVEQTGFHLF